MPFQRRIDRLFTKILESSVVEPESPEVSLAASSFSAAEILPRILNVKRPSQPAERGETKRCCSARDGQFAFRRAPNGT